MHLWRWPTLMSQTGPTEVCCPILTNWFITLLLFSRFHLCREFGKGSIRNHSSWSGLMGKCCSIYLDKTCWSPTSCSVRMEVPIIIIFLILLLSDVLTLRKGPGQGIQTITFWMKKWHLIQRTTNFIRGWYSFNIAGQAYLFTSGTNLVCLCK